MAEERLMIFIDGRNLMGGAKRYGNFKIDYIKLATFLSDGRRLNGIYYYNSIPNNNPLTQKDIDKQNKFYKLLQYMGYKTTIIPLKNRSYKFDCKKCGATSAEDKPIEKGIDVALATDMISLALDRAYDVVTLVSGDYDYHKTIGAIKKLGLTVEVAYFDNCGIAPELIQLADRFIDLGKNANEIEFKK